MKKPDFLEAQYMTLRQCMKACAIDTARQMRKITLILLSIIAICVGLYFYGGPLFAGIAWLVLDIFNAIKAVLGFLQLGGIISGVGSIFSFLGNSVSWMYQTVSQITWLDWFTITLAGDCENVTTGEITENICAPNYTVHSLALGFAGAWAIALFGTLISVILSTLIAIFSWRDCDFNWEKPLSATWLLTRACCLWLPLWVGFYALLAGGVFIPAWQTLSNTISGEFAIYDGTGLALLTLLFTLAPFIFLALRIGENTDSTKAALLKKIDPDLPEDVKQQLQEQIKNMRESIWAWFSRAGLVILGVTAFLMIVLVFVTYAPAGWGVLALTVGIVIAGAIVAICLAGVLTCFPYLREYVQQFHKDLAQAQQQVKTD